MITLPLDVLLPFSIAAIALAWTPGPDNLFVLAQAAQHGRAAGLIITLGLCSGLVIHTSAVVFGLAAVLQTTPIALLAVQVAGALYLLYLAQGAWRAAAAPLQAAEARRTPLYALYGRGILMNATNPKVSLFFLAFLPQFADPTRGPLSAQFIQLGLVFIAATLLVFGTIALLAGTIGQWLTDTPRAQRAVNGVAACVFLGLAVRLLADLH